MNLSIDISNTDLYAVEANYSAGGVTVAKTAQITLPPNTVEDGVIKNHAALDMAINKMLSARNIVAGKAAITFNSNMVLTRRLELPQSKPAELGKMVKNEMIQVVADTGEYVYEYAVIYDKPDQNGLVPIWAYALPKEIVDEYYNVFKNRRMKPIALDLHSNSIEKLLSGAAVNGNQYGGNAVLFICLEKEYAEIHLFSEGVRAFSRIAPVSVLDLSVILENLGASSVSPSLENLDLNDPNIKSNIMVSETAQAYINRLTDELQKMQQFQLRRNSANPIKAVYLYGGVSGIGGLAQSLTAAAGINVEQIQSISKVSCSSPIANFVNAIGAAIRL